jgi:hypothetical protein
MEHIGIDLGSKESQVCVRTAEGKIIGEWRLRMEGLIRFLEGRPAARIILETCTEAFASRCWRNALGMTSESSRRRSCGLWAWGIED